MIQRKAIQRYFPVVLFIMLCEVVIQLESMDEIVKFDHSNETYCLLSHGAVCYAVLDCSNAWVCE